MLIIIKIKLIVHFSVLKVVETFLRRKSNYLVRNVMIYKNFLALWAKEQR